MKTTVESTNLFFIYIFYFISCFITAGSVINGNYFTIAEPADTDFESEPGIKGCESGILYPDTVK